ncbi:MAG: RluA family pseudouridine synthase [Clostridia bacterium]|nr:RluA family pseudouridine synthase [Clostridia bacterium]
MIEIINQKEQKLSKLCLSQKGMTYGKLMSLLKKKNIKINDIKTNKDVLVNIGDKITIYGFETTSKNPIKDIIFEDENLIVINKPKGMQVKKEDVLDNMLCVEDYFSAKCVHRLDRNTSGLLILAKNKDAENEFKKAFREHLVEKYYKALCYGKFTKSNEVLKGFLVKDKQTKLSKVLQNPCKNSVEIITEYKVLKNYGGVSLLEIKLITGKTHQIRAHLTSINHSLVGDSKYQNKEFTLANKKMEKTIKSQCLVAYKLKFNFEKTSFLSYLNNKEFVLDTNFETELKSLGLLI